MCIVIAAMPMTACGRSAVIEPEAEFCLTADQSEHCACVLSELESSQQSELIQRYRERAANDGSAEAYAELSASERVFLSHALARVGATCNPISYER